MLRKEPPPTSLHCQSGVRLGGSRLPSSAPPPTPSVHTWLRHWVSVQGLGLA